MLLISSGLLLLLLPANMWMSEADRFLGAIFNLLLGMDTSLLLLFYRQMNSILDSYEVRKMLIRIICRHGRKERISYKSEQICCVLFICREPNEKLYVISGRSAHKFMREKWKRKNNDVYMPESANHPNFIACICCCYCYYCIFPFTNILVLLFVCAQYYYV